MKERGMDKKKRGNRLKVVRLWNWKELNSK